MLREIELALRHDVPGSDWAWGATFQQYRESEGFRLDQKFRSLDAPGIFGAFVEHKGLRGLTVRATVDNLLGVDEGFNRIFYDGRRNAAGNNILLIEDRHRGYGPIFTLSISGTI